MFKTLTVFGSFSVPHIDEAKTFYKDVLGFKVSDIPEGFEMEIAPGQKVFVYPSEQNKPADFTILNIVVENIEDAIDELAAKGVVMEQYDMPGIKTDEKGIARGDAVVSPRAMAWFKDPAGNILSLLQEQ